MENIVKQTAKTLGLTYRELGEAIGYNESTLKKSASTGDVSDSMQKAIELYLEVLELKTEIEQVRQFKTLLKELTK